MAGRVDYFAARLGLDRSRVARWAFVKSLGWNWGLEVAELFASVAELDL